ncbi:TfoX/Sxy family protein [Nocardioides sp.]|uniref:TfoX/Sxy family protein n=1 Tax=Nocardioides sp. TaxID=35761 RepID=UPI0027332DCC|nr:TfoX/Sxy family protein [Nocardioides sp.]MDP3892050.1 TfoX/Sxy family protein [Nocardioides sp.]
MSTADADLADRIRVLLAAEESTREVRMFGGVSFMVNESMVVAARPDGDLLVRIAPERSGELTAQPGAEPAEMGSGRSMGPGWISVAREAIADDRRLSSWLEAALDHNAR